MVKWVDIKGFEGLYQISSDGRYRHTKRISKVLKPTITIARYDRNGKPKYTYLKARLSKKGKQTTYSIHRLVAHHFIYNPDGLPQVNHKDGDKLNNNVNNLEWVTGQENVTHARQNGLIQYQNGENNPNVKKSYDLILKIKALLKDCCYKQVQIAKAVGVHPVFVSEVKLGKKWAHIEV